MSSIELTTTEDHIAVLSISRPEPRNALSANTLAALHRTFDEIASRPELRAVVLTGAGTSFCAGADMKATAEDMNDTDGSGLRCHRGGADRPRARRGRRRCCTGDLLTAFAGFREGRRPKWCAL